VFQREKVSKTTIVMIKMIAFLLQFLKGNYWTAMQCAIGKSSFLKSIVLLHPIFKCQLHINKFKNVILQKIKASSRIIIYCYKGKKKLNRLT